MIDPKILERIRKLHAHAESAQAIGNEQEALTYAAAVRQMLEKYELDMSDVEFAQHQQEEPIKSHVVRPWDFGLAKKAKRQPWEVSLGMAVAEAHQCDIIFDRGANSMLLVGRRTNRMVAEYMLITLLRAAEDLADKAYTKEFYRCRDEGDVKQARGYRRAFLIGFVRRIGERYQEEVRLTKEAYAKTPHALIRLSSETALVKQVTEIIMKGIGGGMFTINGTHRNLGGVDAGKAAADKVAIRGTGLGSEPAGKPRTIAAPPKQLGSGS